MLYFIVALFSLIGAVLGMLLYVIGIVLSFLIFNPIFWIIVVIILILGFAFKD